ncbi:MAG: Ppx/GppA phosphatase family protein [Solirubrobacterales bacterium]
MRVAILDLGTNSTRVLVADVVDGQVDKVYRESTVTRLGRGVDLTQRLSHEAINDVCKTVRGYLEKIAELGVDTTVALATSAVRDASNGQAFVAELREQFALDARVIDGETESRLTHRGATLGREDDNRRTLVVDIGGGSTEVSVGAGDEVHLHASLQVGVIRQTERHLASDPPAPRELDALATDVREALGDRFADDPDAHAEHAVAVAGTPTSLAAVDGEIQPYDPDRVQGAQLPMPSIQRMLSRLSSLPLQQRAEVPGLHPRRAQSIVAGAVILVEVMRCFELSEIEVSERDILWGGALAAAEGTLGA